MATDAQPYVVRDAFNVIARFTYEAQAILFALEGEDWYLEQPGRDLRVGLEEMGKPMPSKRDPESSSSSNSAPLLAARLVEPPPAKDVQDGLLHPAHQVFFRAGLLACREYMARFVEAESPSIAMSIRANWWPSLGQDFGPPRKLEWGEVTDGEYGTPEFRVKTAEEVSPTQEALPVALGFLESQRPGSALDRLPRCAACGSADLVYWTDDYSKCVACGGKVLQAGRLVDPSPPQKIQEDLESRMVTKADSIDSLTAATARADSHAERYRYEPDAMAIVQAVRRDLWPEMDSNDGGELLGWILNLCVKIQREQAARVDPSPLAQRSENTDDQARVDGDTQALRRQDLPQSGATGDK